MGVGAPAESTPAAVPSTLDGIHLEFGMQGRLSTTQAEAVAAASAGDLVVALPIQIHRFGAAMKAANPSVKLFAYQNGMFAQSKDGSTFPASWYLTDAAGAKVRAAKTGNYLMNPLSTQSFGGAAGWTQYVEQQCAAALADPNTSGCFLDQMNAAPLGSGFVNGRPVDPRTGQAFTNSGYMSMVAAHGQQVASQLGAPVIGNAYDSAPRYYSIPTSIVNQAAGVNVDEAEHWFGNDVTQSRVLSAWQQGVQMEMDAQAAGHGTVLSVDGPGTSVEQWRSYLTASYLLGDNGGAWLEFSPDGNTAPFDSLSPLYDLPIGQPTQTASTVAGYNRGGWYQRDYTNGTVLVNPSGSSVTVTLDGTYQDVNGQTFSSITLPAWSGAVLVSDGSNPPPPPVAPADSSPPALTGSGAVGTTLTALPGTWTGTPAPTYSYQWQRCDGSGTCTDLSGATAKTHVVGSGDAGFGLRVEVTATNTAGSASADSPIVGVTAAPPASPITALSVTGSGWRHTAVLTLSAPGAVTITFVNSAGTAVRHFMVSTARPAGTTSALWASYNDAKLRVPAGRYKVVVTVVVSGASFTRSHAFTVG